MVVPEIKDGAKGTYFGRLHDIGGRVRGPIPASTRARRDKMIYHSESSASSEETPSARQDSYQTPALAAQSQI